MGKLAGGVVDDLHPFIGRDREPIGVLAVPKHVVESVASTASTQRRRGGATHGAHGRPARRELPKHLSLAAGCKARHAETRGPLECAAHSWIATMQHGR